MKDPVYCMIEPTWNCPLSCYYCPRYGAGVDMGDRLNLSLDQFNYILDQFPSLKNLNMAGCGEPLSSPYFFDMIKEATRRDLSITMTSNGLLWTTNTIKKLPTSSRLTVHVSIDSPDPEVYYSCRGTNLNTILKNLDSIKQLRPDINLVIQPLIMKKTLEKMDKIVPLARKYNAKLSPIYPICFSRKLEDELSPFYLPDFEKKMIHLHSLASYFGVNMYSKPPSPVPKDCVEPELGPTISVKGEIFPCCYIYESRNCNVTPSFWNEYYNKEKVTVPQGNYILGNIFKDDFKIVWKGENYRAIRENLVKYRAVEKTGSYSRDQYILLRNKNTGNKYDYCRKCLWRWNQAC